MNDPDTRESAPPRDPAAPEPEYPPGDYRLFAIDFFKTWPAVTWIAALLCTMGAALAALGFAALDWLPQPVSPVAAIIECLLLVACGALLCASGVRLFLFTVAVRRQHQGGGADSFHFAAEAYAVFWKWLVRALALYLIQLTASAIYGIAHAL